MKVTAAPHLQASQLWISDARLSAASASAMAADQEVQQRAIVLDPCHAAADLHWQQIDAAYLVLVDGGGR